MRSSKSLPWKDVWSRRLSQHTLVAPRRNDELVEVVRLSAYGPATPRDFAQWFGLPPGVAHTMMQEVVRGNRPKRRVISTLQGGRFPKRM